MSYSVETFSDENIVYARMPADFDYKTEGEAIIKDVKYALDHVTEPVYYIADLVEADWEFIDIMSASSRTARGQDPILHHSNVKEVIFVATSGTWKLIAEGFSNELFGSLVIKVFDTREATLAYVRSQ